MKRQTVAGYRRRSSKTTESSEPETQAPGVLWVGIHVTEAFAVGRLVDTEIHGSLALAARMGTDLSGRGFHTESDIAGFRTIIQDSLAKHTTNPDEFGLEKQSYREFFSDYD